ncbi:MAG: hypothetical protein Q7S86_05525 [bacterium]|nr:hypothetical protein [bacterium]
MKVFMDIGSEGPIRKAIEQIFTTVGEIEFVGTVREADAILVSEPEKVAVYLERTTKRVAQVLWWKQKSSTAPQGERFKVFDALETKKLPGLSEAIKFLKGE